MASIKSSRDSPSILSLLMVCSVLCLRSSIGRNVSGDEELVRIRGVNLGGWLLTEGWITPSLFDGIPNKDLLDGTVVQLMSAKTGKYLSASAYGGEWIVATDSITSHLGTFYKLWRINETTCSFRVPMNKQFWGLDGTRLVAVTKVPSASETFQIVRSSHDMYRIRIKAPNGLYLQVNADDEKALVTADSRWREGWRDDDPSVFVMTVVKESTKTCSSMLGDFQLANGYGPEKASHVLREHWRTYITEKDFKFMSKNGVNGVRIPVGWWIASDPSPPWPYVGGSLHALDKAFSWAEKYDIKIIIDLHALPGSQNGFYHGSSRDGLDREWGQTDESIQQSVAIVEFLTSRYAKRSSLHGIGLMNEPVAPAVTLEMTNRFYKAGYEAVRRHSSDAYVLFARRIWPPGYFLDPLESFPLMKPLRRTVYDLHFYNLYRDFYKTMTVQQNLDVALYNRTAQLDYVFNASGANGPLVFVGEWADEWETMNATEADYKKFAQIQQEVFDKATFGWCYWTLKHVNRRWSFEWMIKHGYIKIT